MLCWYLYINTNLPLTVMLCLSCQLSARCALWADPWGYMWLTASTVIAPIPLPIKIPCQIWRFVLKFQAWKVWAVLCKDKGANRITIHFTDFIATVEATGAEHLQQVMVSGNDGPLRLVHWSCNITPGFYWQLEQSFLLLMSFDEKKKSYALVNLIRCSFVHKKSRLLYVCSTKQCPV